jgi:hypothetical protein
VFFLIGGLFRGFAWRHWAGYSGQAGHTGHGDWGQGPVPPWAKEWQERHHAQQEKDEERKETLE